MQITLHKRGATKRKMHFLYDNDGDGDGGDDSLFVKAYIPKAQATKATLTLSINLPDAIEEPEPAPASRKGKGNGAQVPGIDYALLAKEMQRLASAQG
jgi:hypothetical protein